MLRLNRIAKSKGDASPYVFPHGGCFTMSIRRYDLEMLLLARARAPGRLSFEGAKPFQLCRRQ